MFQLKVAWCDQGKGIGCRAMISNVVGVGFLRGYHTTGELGKYRRGMLYWVCRSENYDSMERECLVGQMPGEVVRCRCAFMGAKVT